MCEEAGFNLSELNPPCMQRAEIYKRQLCEAYKTLRHSPRLGSQHRLRCHAALCDRELLNQLARILDEYVIVGVAADLGRCRPTLYDASHSPSLRDLDPTKAYDAERPDRKKDGHQAEQAYAYYFDRYINKVWRDQDLGLGPGVELFHERHAMIGHAVNTIAENFANNIITACERICNDWEAIDHLFFTPGTSPIKVAKITSTGSDFHKGGQQVIIFTFQCVDNNNHKLVYKPADVELDYRLVGNTHLDTLDKTGLGAGQSLTELINGFLADDYKLPTYRVLPRNPGSGLQVQNGSLPIDSSYGYIQFLTHFPQDANHLRPGQPSDWVTDNKDDIQRFYRQWGGLLAMGSLFSLSDMHVENVIAHDRQPHLIDLEISLTGPMTTISGTLALEFPIGGLQGYDHKEIRRMRTDDRTANLRVDDSGADEFVPRTSTLNRIQLSTNRAEPRDYIKAIVFGFTATMKAFRAHANELTQWLNDTRVQNAVARFTPYGTGDFNTRLRLLYSPRYCSSAVPKNPGDFRCQPYTDWEQNALKAYQNPMSSVPGESLGWPSPRPNYAIQIRENNYTDYLNCDVPAYYHRLNSRDLLNARGERVTIGANPQNTYFPQSTHSIVSAQIADLNDNNKFQARLKNSTDELIKTLGLDPKKFESLMSALRR